MKDGGHLSFTPLYPKIVLATKLPRSDPLTRKPAKILAKMSFQCPFSSCKSKVWHDIGFNSQKDLDNHLQHHTCQWLIPNQVAPMSFGSHHEQHRYSTCQYLPKDDVDLRLHIEGHISSNEFM